MLLLFETAAGFALFKVLKEGKLKETDVRLQSPAPEFACPTLWLLWLRLTRRRWLPCRTCTRTLSRWIWQRRC